MMMTILSPDVVGTVGAVIVGAVLIQVVLMLLSSYRRLSIEDARAKATLSDLEYRADILLAQRSSERDRVEYSWNGFRKFEIERIVAETNDINSYYLRPHDGKPLPPFLPGQHLTFQLKSSDLPKPVVRCYSLSDSPNHPEYYRISIKKVPPPRNMPDVSPGLASSFFHDKLEIGDILDVKAPAGHFYLQTTKDNPVVLIGGGIGITPVLSMLNTLCEAGSKREIWFFLGVKNSKDHPMKEHLEALALEHGELRMNICYSSPEAQDVEGKDYQHAERVSVDLFKRSLPSNNYTFYICGPPPMMETVTADLKSWGVPDKEVHFEAFGPATVKRTKQPATQSAENKQQLEVVFSRSGTSLSWDGTAESLLDFAEQNGVDIDSGCRAGSCGTCITAIKSGDVVYNIEPGSEPEDGSCLTCIATPKTDLTLDA